MASDWPPPNDFWKSAGMWLGKAVKTKGVFVTNVRFGFVDTKMAKGKHKPFMMTKAKAVEHLMKCINKKPLEYSAPLRALPLVTLLKLFS